MQVQMLGMYIHMLVCHHAAPKSSSQKQKQSQTVDRLSLSEHEITFLPSIGEIGLRFLESGKSYAASD